MTFAFILQRPHNSERIAWIFDTLTFMFLYYPQKQENIKRNNNNKRKNLNDTPCIIQRISLKRTGALILIMNREVSA